MCEIRHCDHEKLLPGHLFWKVAWNLRFHFRKKLRKPKKMWISYLRTIYNLHCKIFFENSLLNGIVQLQTYTFQYFKTKENGFTKHFQNKCSSKIINIPLHVYSMRDSTFTNFPWNERTKILQSTSEQTDFQLCGIKSRRCQNKSSRQRLFEPIQKACSLGS